MTSVKMSDNMSEDGLSDLPALEALFPPRPLMATSETTGLRRSPRKKNASYPARPEKRQTQSVASPQKRTEALTSTQKPSLEKASWPKKTNAALTGIPLLPRNTTVSEVLYTSNNRRSPLAPRENLKIVHLDHDMLPSKLSKPADENDNKRISGKSRRLSPAKKHAEDVKRLAERDGESTSRSMQRSAKQLAHYTSRFVLKEAHCDDDEDNSNDEDEDEDTDLSGFIVDDDVEPSVYDTSDANSDGDSDEPVEIEPPVVPRRRRLHRGSPTRRRLNFGEDDTDVESGNLNSLATALDKVALNDKEGVEVVDLTSSPAASATSEARLKEPSPRALLDTPARALPVTSNLFKNFDAILKFSPPSSKPSLAVPSKEVPDTQTMAEHDDVLHESKSIQDASDYKTPPATPPRSPSKLKSPSKLLSPSKRQAIPHSPHRQSTDAFWDHNVVNEWNDEFSPKKAPLGSPAKRGLARFQIWSDSEDGMEDKSDQIASSLPSPCESPRKSKSPMKSPEKEEKKRLLQEKRATAAARKAFDARKEQLATDLLQELDEGVAKNELSRLSSTTGGVKIVWSKTLRSTAGRANWKRTVTKLSGSPVKGKPDASEVGLKVQHFASIELAEKIIDCEDRLVNTLAHEFCHLTNFMISNVRDQPHGASFKEWARKVTNHLRSTNVASWRKVEVTTKHNYEINHKYLWVCVGRPQTSAMQFLNVEDDEGCGAEYGRHSKSIDVEKHRCGKCKGFLVQVRPKPRGVASPKKKVGLMSLKREDTPASGSSRSSSSGSQSTGFGSLVIELSD
jgi:predicted SprT family Zn-dependent metalloprotease